jgi:hypothetical protein
VYNKLLRLVEGENKMVQVKQLDWKNREDAVVHADPEGLVKSYYIYPPQIHDNDTNKFLLVHISDSGYVYNDETTTHDDLTQAQNKAQQHYEKLVNVHIAT